MGNSLLLRKAYEVLLKLITISRTLDKWKDFTEAL